MKHNGDVVVIKTGILEVEGKGLLAPTMEFFTKGRDSYMQSLPGTQQFNTMPGV